MKKFMAAFAALLFAPAAHAAGALPTPNFGAVYINGHLFAVTDLASVAADSVIMNATGASAAPTAVALPTTGTNGCAGSSNALGYNTTTHAFVCNTISGSGSPGGSNTQVQYNNAGAFAGSANFTFNGAGTIAIGTAGSQAGFVQLYNATSGSVTLKTASGALGSVSTTFPAANTNIPIASQTLTFSGPTAARTYTLPDSNQTLLYSGGALGTPSSGTLTNATGLPISTGISGLGTSVATALGVNVGSAGSVVVNGGALGTPSSGTATNLTGLPYGGLASGAIASSSQYQSNTASTLLTPNAAWSSGALTALTDAATIAVDFSTGYNFSVTLGGNRTLGNPSNMTGKVGQTGCIYITQDATGSRTLAYSSNWKFAGGTAPTLTTTAGATDVLCYQEYSTTAIFANMINNVK